jgi:hypothetical protein
MKRFIEGEDRRQTTLLPDCLEDYVSEDNSVRVVEVFIEELDLAALGFDGAVLSMTVIPALRERPSPGARCVRIAGRTWITTAI